MDRLFDESFCQLLGVANCRGCQNELWIRAVEICHTFESSEHICYMRAEYATIRVRFVNDDELEIGEEIHPVGVMRQDACMDHVRVRQYDARIFTNCRSCRLGSITVIDGSVGDN